MAPGTNKNFELKSAKSFAMGVPVSPGKMVMDVEMAALDTASVMTVFLFSSKYWMDCSWNSGVDVFCATI